MKKQQEDLPRTQWTDVQTRVVSKDRCCGCGLCAVVCPVDECIRIQFDRNKEYKPCVNHETCSNCGLCLRVCPDDLKLTPTVRETYHLAERRPHSDPILGEFIQNWVGYSTTGRCSSASGGILTAVLCHLLRSRRVDGIVTAVPAPPNDQNRLFEAGIVTSDEALLQLGGSKYYPIEYSEVLKLIDRTDGKFAVVTLPCTVLAIRKAQVLKPRLRERILFVFSLVCGHNVSAAYTEYLLESNGLPPANVLAVRYRDKVGISRANEYNLAVEYRDEERNIRTKRLGFFRSNVGPTWWNYMFAMNKCLYCTDVFGELSDASFCDAWLDEYLDDAQGTSIVTIRSSAVADVMDELVQRGLVRCTPIEVDRVKEAQRSQIEFKGDGVAERVALLRRLGCQVPDDCVTETKEVRLLNAISRQVPIMLHVHLSKWMYRKGLLTRIGTKRFLKLVAAITSPVRGLTWLSKRLRPRGSAL